MTRVGWVVLVVILAAAALFASLLRFGGLSTPSTVFARNVDPPAPAKGLIVPVTGIARDQLTDTWGQARGEGRVHHGTDIIAPAGTPVVAAAAGTVEKLFGSTLGGTTLYERSADRRWVFYYAHLAGYAPGIHEGQQVTAGTVLGYVGDTGNAGPGNYHLHFGLTRTEPAQGWSEGEDVNPYLYIHTAGTPLP